MAKVIINEIGVTDEELKILITPIHNEDGTVSHKSPIVVNPDRLKTVIGKSELDRAVKIKVHKITVKMVEVLNELGMNQYLPDKFKPVLPPLFATAILSDKKFIGELL